MLQETKYRGSVFGMDIEIANLKANVNNLSHCLYALLMRIERLDGNEPKTINGAVDELISVNDIRDKNKDSDEKVSFFPFTVSS